MIPNHDIELAKYIDECRDRPFAWGSHDCLTFAAGCVYAQTGRATLYDMLGDYTCPMSALIHARRRIKKFDYPSDVSIIDALDERLDRVETPYPARGSITARRADQQDSVTGYALGVCLRRHSAFLYETGMIFLDREPADLFWSVG
jgi:hypothetical protein